MTTLSQLNVEINGDDSGLTAAVTRSESALQDLGAQAGRTGAQIRTSGNMSAGYARQTTMAAGSTANLAAQFNDIGLMLASGQSPLMLALQQGTQVNQVLSQMGTSGVSRLGALRTALFSVVSPANLVTLAIIAGGAALVQWGMKALSASRATNTFEDALEDWEDIASQANRAANILEQSVEDLAEKYGEAAGRVRELAMEELIIAEARATRALQERAREVRNVARGYEIATDAAIAAAGAWASGIEDTNAMRLTRIMDEFGLAEEAAHDLGLAFGEIRDSASLGEQQAALERIRDILEQAGVPLSLWPEDLQEAVAQMNELEQATIEVEAAARRGREAIAGLASGATDMGSVPAADDASPLSKVDNEAYREGLQTRLEDLQESLMSEEELQIAHFQRQQELLQSALQQQLITKKEYQDLMREAAQAHADALAEIDVYRYGTGLQMASQFFGDMASALKGSNDKMLQIAKAFGAAEALINAWRAYSQVLADPLVPTWQKIPAAAAILAAGMNAVNAINGVGSGGGGARGGGGGGSGFGANQQQAAAPQLIQQANISLHGNSFTADQVRALVTELNKAGEDGALLQVSFG